MQIFPFKAHYPDIQKFETSKTPLSSVRESYVTLRHNGFFKALDEKAIFIYQIIGQNTHIGIIVSNDVNDYFLEKIIGHENTFADKEQTIVEITERSKALSKPILLTYPDHDIINRKIDDFIASNPPLLEVFVPESQQSHTIWMVTDATLIEDFTMLFREQIPKSYIADGHHRTSMVAQILQKHNSENPEVQVGLLCAYFPFSALNIYDFSRAIQLENIIEPKELLVRLESIFNIEIINHFSKPTTQQELTLFLETSCYRLSWKSEIQAEAKRTGLTLDVEMFNTYVLEQILQFSKIQTANCMEYINGTTSLDTLEEKVKTPNLAIFNFYPIKIDEIVAKADANQVLPPKSTWFEPRIKSGLIVLEF